MFKAIVNQKGFQVNYTWLFVEYAHDCEKILKIMKENGGSIKKKINM